MMKRNLTLFCSLLLALALLAGCTPAAPAETTPAAGTTPAGAETAPAAADETGELLPDLNGHTPADFLRGRDEGPPLLNLPRPSRTGPAVRWR